MSKPFEELDGLQFHPHFNLFSPRITVGQDSLLIVCGGRENLSSLTRCRLPIFSRVLYLRALNSKILGYFGVYLEGFFCFCFSFSSFGV